MKLNNQTVTTGQKRVAGGDFMIILIEARSAATLKPHFNSIIQCIMCWFCLGPVVLVVLL